MTWTDYLDRRILPYLGLIFGLFATTPLVWVRLFGTSIAPYHVFALGLIMVVAITPGAIDTLQRLIKSGKLIWAACGLLAVAMMISFAGATIIFEPFFFVKYVAFVATALATGMLFFITIRRGGFPVVALMPAVAGVIFVAFISVQFSLASIDPIEVLTLAIARVDPNIVMNQLFRAAFAASNDDVLFRSNLKQSLSFAFIVMIPIGLLALSYAKFANNAVKAIALAGIGFAVVMTIAPFSRAAWLALFLIGLCYAISYVRTAVGLSIFAGILGLGIPMLFVLGGNSSLFQLIEARLTASDSLDARVFTAEEHWQAIGESPFLGRSEIVEGWAHNVIIDAWSAFGILGMVAALLFFLAMLGMTIKALILTLSAPLGQRKVHATIAALLCPALVRMVTAPNVTIDFPVWVGLGMALALAADAWGEATTGDQARASSPQPRGRPAFQV